MRFPGGERFRICLNGELCNTTQAADLRQSQKESFEQFCGKGCWISAADVDGLWIFWCTLMRLVQQRSDETLRQISAVAHRVEVAVRTMMVAEGDVDVECGIR